MVRAAIRFRLRESTGASVATTITIDPQPEFGPRPASSRPIGAPAIVSEPPKLLCTNTPTVYAPARLDAVPMPPFQPNVIVPAPAPTDPSATGPIFAA